MRLCGICKTLYPDIVEDTDEICIECQMLGDDHPSVEMAEAEV